jgi:hypothetical protein
MAPANGHGLLNYSSFFAQRIFIRKNAFWRPPDASSYIRFFKSRQETSDGGCGELS